MKKITFSIILLLSVTVSSIAQRKYDEIVTTENAVQDLVQNEITGVIVFKEGGTVKGLDPETKKVIWTLTKDDFGTLTSKDVLSDPDFGNLFKEKRDYSRYYFIRFKHA